MAFTVTFPPSPLLLTYPIVAPELELQGCGSKAIRTAFKLVGYGRRISKKKGFLDDPAVRAKRLAFAQEGIIWSKERLYRQIFSDEVWAYSCYSIPVSKKDVL